MPNVGVHNFERSSLSFEARLGLQRLATLTVTNSPAQPVLYAHRTVMRAELALKKSSTKLMTAKENLAKKKW